MSHNRKIILGALLFLILLVAAYANHFDNGFYFDDSHTIVRNAQIQRIENIPRFFTDASTFSSLPRNQAYRPMVTTLNAIDYWIAGGLVPFYFHLSIFLWYVVQIVLMFFVFRAVLDRSAPHEWNAYVALFAVAFYALHTANAETINYIISRSDSFSTLCIVATLFFYQTKATRKFQLHLLALILGIYTKQTGAMAAPLLFVYILFFEERASWRGALNLRSGGALRGAIVRSAPALIIAIGLFSLNQFYLTPASTVSSNEGASRLDYFATQLFVVTHYLANFVLPFDLSADPDFEIIGSLADPRVLFGVAVNATLIAVALACFGKMRTRPISFGILWFYLTLAPTSSFVPLFQIANDHRTFVAYIGLVLSLAALAGAILVRLERRLRADRKFKAAVPAIALVVIGLHAFGTYQRNRTWDSAESLWLDVTVKSPRSAHGLMNYGVTQMEKGNYPVALDLFERALDILPRHSFLHINMAILKDATGNDPQEVETYYKRAMQYGGTTPEAYYHYAKWLRRRDRRDEARRVLQRGFELSPGHSGIRQMLSTFGDTVDEEVEILERRASERPTPERLLDLSRAHYQARDYERAIAAARRALEIDPGYASAYNNICSAYCKLKEWNKAIENCRKALEIDPDLQLAKNNLSWAMDGKRR